jgi:hypothetical protein
MSEKYVRQYGMIQSLIRIGTILTYNNQANIA